MSIKNIFLFAITVLIILGACKKTTELLDDNNKWVPSDQTQNANVKFINTFPSLTPALTNGAGPALVVYRDAQRVVPSTPAPYPMTYGVQFPNSTTYSLVPVGATTFYYIMNRVSNGSFAPVAGDTVFRNTATLEAGKYYTMFLVDTVPNPKVLAFEDVFTIPDLDKYKARFVNLTANPADRYDVYSDKNTGNIFSNVGYKEMKDFIDLPVPSGTDTLRLRLTGTTADISKLAFFATPQRVYTLFSRGKTGVTGRPVLLTFYTNR